MNTIINKKGNIGYDLTVYNTRTCYRSGGDQGVLSQIEVLSHVCDHGTAPIQIQIRKVKVHSCGKVVMRLIDLDDTRLSEDGWLSGHEYCPTRPIYETMEGAKAGAIAYHKLLLDNTRGLDDADSVLECYKDSTLELETVLHSDWVKNHQYSTL